MIKKRYERKVFMSLLMTFLAVLIIPMSTTVFLAVGSINEISKEINKANEFSFESSFNALDKMFIDTIDITNLNSADSRIRTYLASGYRDIMTEYQLSQVISASILGYKHINAAYLYYPEQEVIITANVSIQIDDYFKSLYGSLYTEAIDSISNVQGLSFITMPQSVKSDKTYAFVRKLYPQNPDNMASIVVEINESAIHEALKSMLWIDGSTLSIFNHDIVIATTISDDMTKEVIPPLLEACSNQVNNISLKKVKHSLLYNKSQMTGFTYIYAVPTSKLKSSSFFTAKYVTAIVPFTLILALLLCWQFARKNYSQIKKILLIFQRDNNITPQYGKSNVYELIEQSVLTYSKKNMDITKQIDYQNDQMQQMYLEKLLLGKVKYFNNITESCKMYNIDFKGSFFTLVRITVDDDSMIFDDDSIEADEQSRLITFIIKNVLSDLFRDKAAAHVVDMQDCYICIISTNENTDVFYQTIDNNLQNVRELMENEFKLIMEIDRNNTCCSSINELPSAYREIFSEAKCLTTDDTENYSDIINKCIEIIKSEYTDNNLSVSQIAEKLSLNSSYLSRFFKQQVGIGLLDYIHKYRLIIVKNLLLESAEIPIKTIVEKSGFYNTAALIRVFKKHEGVTPGQYRQQYKQLS